MEDLTVKIPDSTQIQNESQKLIVSVEDHVKKWGNQITTQEQFDEAGYFLRTNKELQKEVVKTFLNPKKLSSDLHKSICETERKFLDPLKKVESLLKEMVVGYVEKQKILAENEYKKAMQEAEKKALEEAEKLKKEKQEERLKSALELESLGFSDEAKKALDTPIDVVAPVVFVNNIKDKIINETKNENVSHRIDFDFEVTDFTILPNEYKCVDEKKLRRVVKAMGADCKIAGVRVLSKTIIFNKGR